MKQHTYKQGCEAGHPRCPHRPFARGGDCDECPPCPACKDRDGRRFRLDAYYFGFEPTGVTEIDEVLCALAWAGKMHHNTEDWCITDNDMDGLSECDRIQLAADKAALAIRAKLGKP